MKDDKPLNSGVRQVAPDPDLIEVNHQERYRWANSQIGLGCTILDVGCGCGYGAKILTAHNRKYVGLDYSAEAIEYAKANYGEYGDFHQCDVTRVPRESACFDVIVAFEIIEHVQDYFLGLVMWRGLLRPGGSLFISAPQAGRKAGKHPFHIRDFTPWELQALLVKASFTVVSTKTQTGRNLICDYSPNHQEILAVLMRCV